MQNNVNTTNLWKNMLDNAAIPEKKKILSSFFKTGKGEYGEGDIFIGVKVPDNREIAKKFFDADFDSITEMLHSEIHEHRLSALLALVEKFRRDKNREHRQAIVDYYLDNAPFINNWDLVDLSAYKIVGEHVVSTGNTDLIMRLSESTHMWTQRIAIVASLALIRKGELDCTYTLADRYISHPHELIHKATGWMLREAGKRDMKRLDSYVTSRAAIMPRTALRYAIERMDPDRRRQIMAIPRQK